MSQADCRDEYLRLAAIRISLLSEIFQLLREQLQLLADPQGRAPLEESRDRIYVRMEGLKDAEDQFALLLEEELAEPVVRLEELIRCRRTLAGSLAVRLLPLLDERLPGAFPERNRLFFKGEGELSEHI